MSLSDRNTAVVHVYIFMGVGKIPFFPGVIGELKLVHKSDKLFLYSSAFRGKGYQQDSEHFRIHKIVG